MEEGKVDWVLDNVYTEFSAALLGPTLLTSTPQEEPARKLTVIDIRIGENKRKTPIWNQIPRHSLRSDS